MIEPTPAELADALRRCLKLAREGTSLPSVESWPARESLAKSHLDAIIEVADSTLAVYGTGTVEHE